MSECYTTGYWTPKAGEQEAFVEAWREFAPEFKERMGRVQEHVEQFAPAELEVVATVGDAPGGA